MDKMEQLIEALREELQEYGELLVVLDRQQELIVQRAASDILSTVDLTNAQMEVIRKARAHRSLCQSELAQQMQMPPETSLTDLNQKIPPKYRPLMQALIEENNHLLHRVQQRTQQNHILLSRSLELLQRLVHSLLRETTGAVYNMDKQIAHISFGRKPIYEALG